MLLRESLNRRAFPPPADHERKEFQRLFRLTFVFFLLIAVVSRLLPRAWRPLASSVGAQESAFDEARRAAYTVVPFVFMR
jgi:hypothetical protein